MIFSVSIFFCWDPQGMDIVYKLVFGPEVIYEVKNKSKQCNEVDIYSFNDFKVTLSLLKEHGFDVSKSLNETDIYIVINLDDHYEFIKYVFQHCEIDHSNSFDDYLINMTLNSIETSVSEKDLEDLNNLLNEFDNIIKKADNRKETNEIIKDEKEEPVDGILHELENLYIKPPIAPIPVFIEQTEQTYGDLLTIDFILRYEDSNTIHRFHVDMNLLKPEISNCIDNLLSFLLFNCGCEVITLYDQSQWKELFTIMKSNSLQISNLINEYCSISIQTQSLIYKRYFSYIKQEFESCYQDVPYKNQFIRIHILSEDYSQNIVLFESYIKHWFLDKLYYGRLLLDKFHEFDNKQKKFSERFLWKQINFSQYWIENYKNIFPQFDLVEWKKHLDVCSRLKSPFMGNFIALCMKECFRNGLSLKSLKTELNTELFRYLNIPESTLYMLLTRIVEIGTDYYSSRSIFLDDFEVFWSYITEELSKICNDIDYEILKMWRLCVITNKTRMSIDNGLYKWEIYE
jgi:hypothetical protein